MEGPSLRFEKPGLRFEKPGLRFEKPPGRRCVETPPRFRSPKVFFY